MSKKLKEVLRFAVAGGVGFLIELAVLTLLHGALGVDTMIATPIAFLCSVAVNYLLCAKWVFEGADRQGSAAKAGFLLTSIMGALLNQLFMYLFRQWLGEETVLFTLLSFPVQMYHVNKALSTLLVMVWNFFTKKKLLKKGQ